ncbi:MAG: DUF4136 domain-containing protein [Flavobacteriaceae bacterium]|nr:DUF4136 domain-containing protein [Flavobacteriaceae bacterium]
MKHFLFQITTIALLALLSVSCGAPRIAYDYDREADFSQYKTFDFHPDMQLYMNQLDSSRVVQEAATALQARGLSRSENPDVYLNIFSEQYETPSNSSVGIGVGGTGRNVGVGISGGIPLQANTLTQHFRVDLIDFRTNHLVWQGNYEGRFRMNLSPEAKTAYFKDVFTRIFEGYPPTLAP